MAGHASDHLIQALAFLDSGFRQRELRGFARSQIHFDVSESFFLWIEFRKFIRREIGAVLCITTVGAF